MSRRKISPVKTLTILDEKTTRPVLLTVILELKFYKSRNLMFSTMILSSSFSYASTVPTSCQKPSR